MFQKLCRMRLLSSVASIVVLAGCQNQHDATVVEPAPVEVSSSHESTSTASESLITVLSNIEAMKSKICKAFADGTPEDAHDELHDVGHSLEKLPELAAAKSNLSAEQLASVNTSVEALFDNFGKLDDTLHGGAEIDIKELDKKLSQAIASLKEAVQ